MNNNIKEKIADTFLLPVVVLDDADRADDTAKALFEGGVNTMEITLRTAAGLSAIKKVSSAFPQMLVGAGTVISLSDCKKAVDSGASFIVSPGLDLEIVEYCQKNDLPIFPGCVTPTEITSAIKAGLEIVKFFPANVFGGSGAIKNLSGPFPNIKFVPTGGIDSKNLDEFFIPPVFAIGGGWLCERKMINTGNYSAITKTCKEAVEKIKSLREKPV